MSSTLALGPFENLSTSVTSWPSGPTCIAKAWSPESPVLRNIPESPANLPQWGFQVQQHSASCVTFGVRLSENCRHVPHNYSASWTLLWEPTPSPLCSWPHRSLFSNPSLPPWWNIFFLLAGKSVFLHDTNLVILPPPRNPLHPLEVRRFMGYFSCLLWCKWQPTPVFLPGESHGQRSLVGYGAWGHKESDTTERLNTHTHSDASLPEAPFTSPTTYLN